MPASALVRRVFIGLLVANLAVVGVKLAVGITSGSLAVLGGAVDSCVDALNNVLALIIVRVAAKEPDEDHPYGHGKFETLGALAIVGFLSITCFELVRGAVNHFVSGSHRVDVSDFQLALLVLTLGVNLLITWYEHRRGIELGSELLVADAAHTRADVFITVGILVGILLTRQGLWWADSTVAIMVALAIVLVAYRILARTVPVLVDQRAIPTRDIQNAARGAAVIQLLNDPASTVGAVVQRTRTAGLVEGDAGGAVRFKFMARDGASVAPGDLVVTSGLGTLFPKGLPVGRVVKIEDKGSALFHFAVLAPAVDFSRVEEVLLVTGQTTQDVAALFRSDG